MDLDLDLFQVNQMIKKPEAVLERLAASRSVPEIPSIALSEFLYCNGQALPLPRVSFISCLPKKILEFVYYFWKLSNL